MDDDPEVERIPNSPYVRWPIRTWQPIETAPMKCGIRLLLSGTYEGHKWIEIGKKDKGSGRWIMDVGGGLLGVTHWMPLPDFPE